MTTLGIVIPTFKRPKWLVRCLKSIEENCDIDRNIYVVFHKPEGPLKDGTEEESRENIKALNIRNIKMLNVPYNMGIAIGRKTGSSSAIFDKCKYIINTDDDCTFRKESFSSLVEVMEADKNKTIGIAASSSGGLLSVFNHDVEGDFVEKPTATGSFSMSRSEYLYNIGNYDENVKNGREDLEICYRMWIYGKRCGIVPKCKIGHKGSNEGGCESSKLRGNDEIEMEVKKYLLKKYEGLLSYSKNGSMLWWRKFKKLTPNELKVIRKRIIQPQRIRSI